MSTAWHCAQYRWLSEFYIDRNIEYQGLKAPRGDMVQPSPFTDEEIEIMKCHKLDI